MTEFYQTTYLKKTRSLKEMFTGLFTKSQVIYFLLFLSFLAPSGINTGIMHSGIAALKYAVCVWILFDVGLRPLLKRKYMLLFLIYYLIITLSTILNHGDVAKALLYLFSNVIFIGAFAYGLSRQNAAFFGALKFYISLILVINLLVRIFGLVTGNVEMVFIGVENHMGLYYMFTLFVWVVDYYVFGRKEWYLLILIGINILFYSGDTTKVLFLLFLLYLVYHSFTFHKRISPMVFFGIEVFLFFGVVFFDIQNVILGSDTITLTGRTYIWEYALNTLYHRPFWMLGYGTTLDSFVPASVITYWSDFFLGTHNDILYRLIMGGPFALMIFFLVHFLSSYYLKRKKGSVPEVLSMTMLIMFIQCMMDNTEWELFFPMFLLAYYAVQKRTGHVLRRYPIMKKVNWSDCK